MIEMLPVRKSRDQSLGVSLLNAVVEFLYSATSSKRRPKNIYINVYIHATMFSFMQARGCI